ncbi:MAG TPA: outer membrane protein [Methylovirgula sp.]|nr:outer membrane protein [Methylovirgula sp.]
MSRLACLIALFILTSSAAVAADAPSPADAPPDVDRSGYLPPPPLPIWAGAYIGGDIGYQWGASSNTSIDNITGAVASPPGSNPAGVIGGAHIGYNWQMNSWVFGLEGNIDGSGVNGIQREGTLNVRTQENIQGSVRARVGASWNHVLAFVDGGLAIGSFQNSFSDVFSGAVDSLNSTRLGWTVGGGLEYALTDNWSIRGEYHYSDYGSYNMLLSNTRAGVFTARLHETSNTALVGFSYKFSAFAPPAPVVMKY